MNRRAKHRKATREVAVQTAVFRGAFTSNARQLIAMNRIAQQGIAKQIGQPITVGFSMCFHIQRTETQRRAFHSSAEHRKATQRRAKQIGLAIGNSGFPDVFSHQLQTAAQGIAAHDNARHRIAKHPGLGIRKSAFAGSF